MLPPGLIANIMYEFEKAKEFRNNYKPHQVVYATWWGFLLQIFTFFLLLYDSRFYFRGIYFVCIKKTRYEFKTKGNEKRWKKD